MGWQIQRFAKMMNFRNGDKLATAILYIDRLLTAPVKPVNVKLQFIYQQRAKLVVSGSELDGQYSAELLRLDRGDAYKSAVSFQVLLPVPNLTNRTFNELSDLTLLLAVISLAVGLTGRWFRPLPGRLLW